MPELSRFYGIVIFMYFNDHPPPHFHAKYGEHKAKFEIATGRMLDGGLPKRSLALIEDWRQQHVHDLEAAWAAMLAREPYGRIDPLE